MNAFLEWTENLSYPKDETPPNLIYIPNLSFGEDFQLCVSH